MFWLAVKKIFSCYFDLSMLKTSKQQQYCIYPKNTFKRNQDNRKPAAAAKTQHFQRVTLRHINKKKKIVLKEPQPPVMLLNIKCKIIITN